MVEDHLLSHTPTLAFLGNPLPVEVHCFARSRMYLRVRSGAKPPWDCGLRIIKHSHNWTLHELEYSWHPSPGSYLNKMLNNRSVDMTTGSAGSFTFVLRTYSIIPWILCTIFSVTNCFRNFPLLVLIWRQKEYVKPRFNNSNYMGQSLYSIY